MRFIPPVPPLEQLHLTGMIRPPANRRPIIAFLLGGLFLLRPRAAGCGPPVYSSAAAIPVASP